MSKPIRITVPCPLWEETGKLRNTCVAHIFDSPCVDECMDVCRLGENLIIDMEKITFKCKPEQLDDANFRRLKNCALEVGSDYIVFDRNSAC